jgi:hypothetical protein
MPADYRNQFSAIAAAVEFQADNNINWCGKPTNAVRPVDDDLTQDALSAYLSRLIYQAAYVFGSPLADLSKVDKPSPRSGSARFVERLLQANSGRGLWQQDVRMDTSTEGRDVVRFAGVQFVVPPEAVIATGPDRQVRLDMPGELLMTSPGHVLLFGDAGPRRPSAERTLRFYWNITAEGAPELVREITGELNAASIPFEFKVRHTDLPWTQRADPAVLYLGYEDLAAAWPLLNQIRARLTRLLRAPAPALTRRAGQGLAVADDPPGKSSFGLHRSDLIAEALVRSHLRGHHSLAQRLSAVEERFAEDGISLDRPYLNPGAAELDLPGIPMNSEGGHTTGRPTDTPTTGHSVDWLDAADRLGKRIARQALWQDNRCTWLERVPDPDGPPTWRASGAELYDGLSGIGLLFAQLWASTGDKQHRRVALGALRHTVDQLSTMDSNGLYAGRAGAGLGVALAARQLAEEDLFRTGMEHITRPAAEVFGDGQTATPELLYGLAGAVVALLQAHRLGEPDALELATTSGKELVAAGRPDGRGMSWAGPQSADPAPVGLAHGASGVVLALSELARATGDTSFRNAAILGCAYERTWFDTDHLNWADLRNVSAGDTSSVAEWDRFHWCYGAPGILLARLSLHQAGAAEAVEQDLVTALAATRRAASAFPKYGHDVSLCHGAAGLAEILSVIPSQLREQQDSTVAQRLVSLSLEAYGEEGPWLAGCGLLTGAGGIAYAALRVARPDIVSPLSLVEVPR